MERRYIDETIAFSVIQVENNIAFDQINLHVLLRGKRELTSVDSEVDALAMLVELNLWMPTSS